MLDVGCVVVPGPSAADPRRRVKTTGRCDVSVPERFAAMAAAAPAPPPGQWPGPSWATMPARPTVELEVRRGEELLKKHELKGRKFFILGRQPVMSHIVVEDDTVSRQHAAVVHCNDALYLFDLKSAKGVAVGGKPIKPMEPRLLSEGDVITLGELAVQYVVKGLGAPPAASSRWQPPAWAVVPSQPVSMHLLRGEEVLQELDLSRKPAYVLGRNGQQADLVVPHDSVSRQHAAILHGAPNADGSSSVHVVDLKSSMGTYLDLGSGWKRLPPNTPTALPIGGKVRLGECSTLLVYPALAPPAAAPKAAEVEDDTPRFASMLQSAPPPPPPSAHRRCPRSVPPLPPGAVPDEASRRARSRPCPFSRAPHATRLPGRQLVRSRPPSANESFPRPTRTGGAGRGPEGPATRPQSPKRPLRRTCPHPPPLGPRARLCPRRRPPPPSPLARRPAPSRPRGGQVPSSRTR